MKIKTVKKRFIQSQAKYKGQEEGLKFWKESLKTLKSLFFKEGKFNASPAYMIEFCLSTNGNNGVAR